MRIWLAPGTPPPICRRRASIWRRPSRRRTGRHLVQAPKPLFPVKNSALDAGSQNVDLVWTSSVEPEAVRFFVELRVLNAQESREAWSGFVDVSSLRLPLPPGAENLAWRVTAVARGSADYSVSGWSVFRVAPL